MMEAGMLFLSICFGLLMLVLAAVIIKTNFGGS